MNTLTLTRRTRDETNYFNGPVTAALLILSGYSALAQHSAFSISCDDSHSNAYYEFGIWRGSTSKEETVRYRTVGITACPDFHFSERVGSVTFAPNEDRKYVQVSRMYCDGNTEADIIYSYHAGTTRSLRFEVLDEEERTVLASYTIDLDFSGVVTTSGITPGSTRLTMFTPREEWSYEGQEGVLLDSDNSIEKKYNYTLASSVLVTDVSDGRITTEEAGFINQQSIYRLSFRYQANASTKTPITAGWVTISGASGELVRSLVPGGATVKGPLSVRLGTPTADPFFVAIRNDDESNEEALTFTVVDGDGITYRGSKTIPAENKVNGSFVSVKNATLPLRMELTETTTVVDAAL